ncbi:MAG: MFS transporter [Planctomycetaceae bacterium]
MNSPPQTEPHLTAETVRLPVTFAVMLIGFIAQTLQQYLFPLYFTAKGLPADAWESWSYAEVIAWIVGPLFAGRLCHRYGERRIWGLGLLMGTAVVGSVWLIPTDTAQSDPNAQVVLSGLGFLNGMWSSFVWVAGTSLCQAVSIERRGLANSLMLTAMGLGSLAGPSFGRLLTKAIYFWNDKSFPLPLAYRYHLLMFIVLALLGAILILIWGERRDAAPMIRVEDSRGGYGILLKNRKFVIAIISLGLCAGPILQAVYVYRPYRVRDPAIALIIGAEDHGWAALEVLGNFMQLVGGWLVGVMSVRLVSGKATAGVLALFSLLVLAMGLAPNAMAMFAASAGLELTRQFIRWAQTGYVSAILPDDQRARGIGLMVLVCSLGSFLFNSFTRWMQSPGTPEFSSSLPFYWASSIGLTGAVILLGISWRKA